ncbi:hypothetical protein [Methylobacterium gnaphalii]|uniref:Uncharacterized protein n=1 Tax=Methylobacterium gnaphalii TaxID=1010610 RepID=A0A512JF70_9HYPH|nr:hypothetical protein [Methylobacterium gnaphalii]GEP08583.1 hypothetical protein MGN01_04280 [Methylobacterium gnaphalii]GJD70582.1 hypothetical protein MMMDOFMJ_3531 [Methylobacterium gnaphalii]GLS50800.1 hypothetical protein GCM10007885_36540 [Methylobacterium gnaphalii]
MTQDTFKLEELDELDQKLAIGILYSASPFDRPAGSMPPAEVRDILKRTDRLMPHLKRLWPSVEAAQQANRERMLELFGDAL